MNDLLGSYISSSSGRRDLARFFAPLLLAFVILIALEIVLRLAGISPPLWFGKHDDEYAEIFTKAVLSQRSGDKICVFIGDSRVEWGVVPEAIQDIFEQYAPHYSFYNLAYPGGNVRTILTGLVSAKLRPECLVVGYSDLSFYYSTAQFFTPEFVSRREILTNRIKHFLSDNLVIIQKGLAALIKKRREGPATDPVNWIGARSISKRGHAEISYRISREAAIAAHKAGYDEMYSKPLAAPRIEEINREFISQIKDIEKQGTRVFMVRMPVAEWVAHMENQHQVYPLAALSARSNAPLLDVNMCREANSYSYLDDLHLSSPSDVRASKLIGYALLGALTKGKEFVCGTDQQENGRAIKE